MKACPIVFQHPSEAQVLNGLGPKLCDRLAEKLQLYCRENGLPMPQKGRRKKKRNDEAAEEEEGEEASPPVKKPRKTQLYVPKLRSGAYALVMALATLDEGGHQALSKKDLIDLAQPFCDSNFLTPSDPTKFYTAWKSMQTLETKELVCTKGHPTKRWYLSDEGWEVAKGMKTANGEPSSPKKQKGKQKAAEKETKHNAQKERAMPQTSRHHIGSSLPATRPIPAEQPRAITAFEVLDLSSDPESPLETSLHTPEPQTATPRLTPGTRSLFPASETIRIPPESFDIRLVLDTREIRTTTDREYIASELKKLGVSPIIRSLPLGDVLWIAQVKQDFVPRLLAENQGDEEEYNTEIVLEHIMERKRLDDLIGSIKDGRFNEQKFRLRKSGIKNVTYLIEDYSISAERSEKYGEAVESVIASMQIVSDIFVKQTSKLDNTIRYLARMTKSLEDLYKKREVRVIRSTLLESGYYLPLLERLRGESPESTFGTTFSAFAAMCDKSDSMTLKDVYLKLLLCIRGVTPDKAVEIQKLWPTPRAFIEAFEARGTTKDKDNMISDRLGDAIPRKKVAKVLSAKIAEVWG